MKIGIFSDSQIGNHFTSTDGRGINQRLIDLIGIFKQTINEMTEKGCDIILFGGDLFKSNQPSVYMQLEVAKILNEAAKHSEIVLLTGNHEISSETFGYFALIDLYKMINKSRIHTISQPQDLIIGDVQICGIPYPNKGMLSPDIIKGLSNEDMNQKMREYIIDIAKTLKPKSDKYSILLAHLAIQGAKGGKGLVLLSDDIILNLSEIAHDPPFNATLLGHYHRQQILSEKPFAAYIGSTAIEDFGEEGQQKKYLIIKTELQGTDDEFEWFPISDRRFITVKMKPDKEFHMKDPMGAMIRLKFAGPKEAYKMNVTAVVSDLYNRGAQEVFVTYDYEVETQLRSDTIHKNMSEIELMEEWLKLQSEDVQKRSTSLMEKIKEIAVEK